MNLIQEAAPPSFQLAGMASIAMSIFGLLVWIFWIYVGWRALMALERIARQHESLSDSLRAIAQEEE